MANGIGTVVIGGGSGFIGTALTSQLRQKGYNVVIISRKPGLWRMTWSELEKKGLPLDCTAVVSMAGQNLLDPTRRWTPGFKQNVWGSRVNTTSSLACAIERTPRKPQAFISMSGVGFYKPSLTDTYTEESPGGDFDFLSSLCSDWEAAARVTDSVGLRQVIIRSGVVLGRQGGMIQQIFIPFYLGLGGPIGSGKQWLPWIHIQDMARLITHAIENDNVTGVLNGVAPQVITNKEFSKAFARALWRPSIIPLPTFAANLAFSEERAKMITEGQKVIPQRTLESGYAYKYPDIQSACREFARLIYIDEVTS